MVIDASALVAMLTDEPDAELFEARVADDPVRTMSTASYLDTAIVIESRFGESGGRELDLAAPGIGESCRGRRRPSRDRPSGLPAVRERAVIGQA